MSDVPMPKTVEQVESIDESGSPLVEDARQDSPGAASGGKPVVEQPAGNAPQ